MNELDGAYPIRLPVWWARRGAAGPHPELEGVTGRFIVIRHTKRFKRFEGLLARLLRAPKPGLFSFGAVPLPLFARSHVWRS